jgi:repressor LexA
MEVLADKVKRATVPSGLPLIGRVAAGTPILAEENIEEYVEVSPLAGGDGGDFVLEVRGESMKNAGILDGDTVVVRKQAMANNGDIVVAMVGGEDEPEAEATVKRYFRERDHIRLEPENENFEPIRSPDVKVVGRVIGVFRRCT